MLCGIVLGPALFGFIQFDIKSNLQIIELLSELVVIVSVFVAGIKMKPSLSSKRWRTPVLLAFLSLTIGVALLTGIGYFALGLPLGVAVILGAVLAPTDPVLASSLQVEDKDDDDLLRFTLTAEAGMNDGSTFPFLMLGLALLGVHELGSYGTHWLVHDVIYKITGAIVIGAVITKMATLALNRLKIGPKSEFVVDEFFGMGLLFLVYGLCLYADVYGFIAAFVAGILFRKHEERDVQTADKEASNEIIQFNDSLEKLGEFVIIVFFGSVLRWSHFSLLNLTMAATLLFIVRPLSVLPSLARMNREQKAMVSWFGIRGVGTFYYLSYALVKTDWTPPMEMVTQIAIVTVTASIILHGLSANPLMLRYKRV